MDDTDPRARLHAMLSDLDQTMRTLDGEHAGEVDALSSIDQHPADLASEVADGEREDAILAVARAQREDVLAALQRLDAGTYGLCVDCGQPLGPDRLAARPEAARCLADQARLEAAP